jgi:hypothetical protein
MADRLSPPHDQRCYARVCPPSTTPKGNQRRIVNYLKANREVIPRWLAQFVPGSKISAAELFASRIVFYPGSGFDGHAVAVFGSSHAAHCFVYADYSVPQADLETQLDHPQYGFRGYHSLARINIETADQLSPGWKPHLTKSELNRVGYIFKKVSGFGFVQVLERERDLDDAHGPARLAILFLGADGFATYDALFCQDESRAPFAVLIQDHGFGGNFDRFDRYGLLETIASRAARFPKYLLVGEGSDAWSDYKRVKGVPPSAGGMHNLPRSLFQYSSLRGQCSADS